MVIQIILIFFTDRSDIKGIYIIVSTCLMSLFNIVHSYQLARNWKAILYLYSLLDTMLLAWVTAAIGYVGLISLAISAMG